MQSLAFSCRQWLQARYRRQAHSPLLETVSKRHFDTLTRLKSLPFWRFETVSSMIGGAAFQALREMEKRLRALEDKIAASPSTQS
jgi:hypothetical protein